MALTGSAALQAAGRLSQVCPTCAIVEAAGSYCTACRTPTGSDHWAADPRKARVLAGAFERGAALAPGVADVAGPDGRDKGTSAA